MYRVVSPYSGAGITLEYGFFIVSYTYAFTQRHEIGEENTVKADLQSDKWLKWKEALEAETQVEQEKTDLVAVLPKANPWDN